jgi:hypothetical protein
MPADLNMSQENFALVLCFSKFKQEKDCQGTEIDFSFAVSRAGLSN